MSNENDKEKKNRAERTTKDAKVSADNRWEMKLMENLKENKNIFKKEVKMAMKGTGKEVRVKAEDDTLLEERNGLSVFKNC